MSTQEMEVASTHCSATFGSRESDSVGVSGKEEPDSCIWHSSSSVMMSNTASSGSLESALAPGPQRQIRGREKRSGYAQHGREPRGPDGVQPRRTSQDTLQVLTQMTATLSRCERDGCWDTPEKQRWDSR